MIRIAIVDDHVFVVEAIEKFISDMDDIQVIDRAYSADGCRKMLRLVLPDVLLLDVGLSGDDGVELCAELLRQYPSLKILMLTTYAEIAVITRALESGALGYVLKNSTSQEIHEGILTVSSGESFLCNKVKQLLKNSANERVTLTGRERELLKLVVEGKTNAEIADKLFLAYQTVKGYRSNLMLKLQVQNTAELVKMAIERKLV
ncbi:MAG: response regulator transcription factor [Bacteroidales bacterium]|nr:response regulator transcription factor [Bacteroidales bacterium]